MPITTGRLVLRRFRLEDAAALAAYRTDPAVARYQSWTSPYSLDKARYAVQTMVAADPGQPGWFQYAVEHGTEQVLIGDVGVNLADNLRQAEIGYTLAPRWQGHGYATEAVSAILDRLFGERGLHKVSAECDARNTASARLLERLGFVREGLRRQHTWIKHEWTDDLLYGLLATEWPRPGR
ncbi:N-acetyltransferase [Actinoplanes sp. NBRC 14428]|uniref:RimJ/RimL family protein N-acetyltransferase n=1 Tax=Pseudosporangium ferrugineum TaxID=439699 RepID=A0A2T0RCE0_9ACTN|nr:GNAT family protein [Pseudosporangium ferrugineum]PRY18832.1 RimJ/RimL family protein N-acetyltransferase [Pseudosporangium ferrugineum]BCJ56325.1 N-acetyltransferase [Actinoplanes sp. NBRC 14428]